MLGCSGAGAGTAAVAPRPPPAEERAAASGPILMSVRGWTMTKDFAAQRQFGVGDALSSGDYFVYYVRVDRPAYVYVLQFLPGGQAKMLFPEDEPVELPAGKELRVPVDPSVWFRLDE